MKSSVVQSKVPCEEKTKLPLDVTAAAPLGGFSAQLVSPA